MATRKPRAALTTLKKMLYGTFGESQGSGTGRFGSKAGRI